MAPYSIGVAVLASVMEMGDIMDELSHAFLLEKMKREVNEINDVETLRQCVLTLVDLTERQKSLFKQMLYSLIEDNPEASELFE